MSSPTPAQRLLPPNRTLLEAALAGATPLDLSTDALRHLYPDEKVYTFWKYFRGAFERDAGLRIDHLLLNRPAAKRLAAAGVDRTARSWEKTSDHAPVWIELK